MCYFTSCGGGKKTEEAPAEEPAPTEAAAPEYKLITDLPMVNLADFPKDADGWITLFDGKTLNGWRGYNRADVPASWVVDDKAIHIKDPELVKRVQKTVEILSSHINLKILNWNGNGKLPRIKLRVSS
jgi:hypothetical protein